MGTISAADVPDSPHLRSYGYDPVGVIDHLSAYAAVFSCNCARAH